MPRRRSLLGRFVHSVLNNKTEKRALGIIISIFTVILGSWLIVIPIREWLISHLSEWGDFPSILVGICFIIIGVIAMTKLGLRSGF